MNYLAIWFVFFTVLCIFESELWLASKPHEDSLGSTADFGSSFLQWIKISSKLDFCDLVNAIEGLNKCPPNRRASLPSDLGFVAVQKICRARNKLVWAVKTRRTFIASNFIRNYDSISKGLEFLTSLSWIPDFLPGPARQVQVALTVTGWTGISDHYDTVLAIFAHFLNFQ